MNIEFLELLLLGFFKQLFQVNISPSYELWSLAALITYSLQTPIHKIHFKGLLSLLRSLNGLFKQASMTYKESSALYTTQGIPNS